MTRPNIGAFLRRNSVTIGIIIVVLAFGTMLFLQAAATAKLQRQNDQNSQIIIKIKDLASSLDGHAADRTTQINRLNKHIDCIVSFFNEKDRASKSISDIDKCTVEDASTGATSNATGGTGVLSPAPPTTTATASRSRSATPTATTPATKTPQAVSAPPSVVRQVTTPVVNGIKGIINFIKRL